MQYNVSKPILGMNGETISNADGDVLRVKHALVEALLSPANEAQNGEEQYKRYNLAREINNKDDVELTHADIILIKKLCAKVLTTLAYGNVVDLLGE